MNADDEKKSTEDNRSRDLSPGKLLVWARERANLTQEQVAKELYMTLAKVRALELDDYRHMGANTFARGYLRAYANLVHLDVVQVLAAYDRHAQKHGLTEQFTPRRVDSANKPLWRFALLMLALLFMLWLISVWFFDNRQASTYERPAALVPSISIDQPVMHEVNASIAQSSSEASAVKSAQVVISSAESTANFSSSASVAAGSIVATAIPLDVSAAATSSLQASATASSAPAVVISEGQQANNNTLDIITLQFTEECWLEVSDSRGDVLAADLQGAESRVLLQGKAPFDVKLGNAPAVTIELNGKNIAVVPPLGTNVLSLKVGQVTDN